ATLRATNLNTAHRRIRTHVPPAVVYREVAVRCGYVHQTCHVFNNDLSGEASGCQIALYIPGRQVTIPSAHFGWADPHNFDVTIACVDNRCALDIADHDVTALAVEGFDVGIARHFHFEPYFPAEASARWSRRRQQQPGMSRVAGRLSFDWLRTAITGRNGLNRVFVPPGDENVSCTAADHDLAPARELHIDGFRFDVRSLSPDLGSGFRSRFWGRRLRRFRSFCRRPRCLS